MRRNGPGGGWVGGWGVGGGVCIYRHLLPPSHARACPNVFFFSTTISQLVRSTHTLPQSNKYTYIQLPISVHARKSAGYVPSLPLTISSASNQALHLPKLREFAASSGGHEPGSCWAGDQEACKTNSRSRLPRVLQQVHRNYTLQC